MDSSMLPGLTRRTEAVFTFKLPAEIADRPGCPKTIGVKELTGLDEVDAANRAGGDQARLAFEMARASLVRSDGNSVHLADGTADVLWEALGPKGRRLVITAYTKVNNPLQVEAKDFLDSQTVTVG